MEMKRLLIPSQIMHPECYGMNTFEIQSVRPLSEVVWDARDHILLRVWTEMWQILRMMGENSFSHSWLQCQRKIKQFRNTIRKEKGANKSDRERMSCPFYDELDKLLGDRLSLCPGEEKMLGTLVDPICSSTVVATMEEANINIFLSNMPSLWRYVSNKKNLNCVKLLLTISP